MGVVAMIEHVQGAAGERLNEIARIWLKGNLDAHSFIDPDYWKHYFDVVKHDIAKSELFIFEENGHVQGFMGMDGHYIAGLFVAKGHRDQGIGSQLMDAAKQTHSELTLSVYEKNAHAYTFYRKRGFEEFQHRADRVTGEFAINMRWKRRRR
jgi:putative acetyltransferase